MRGAGSQQGVMWVQILIYSGTAGGNIAGARGRCFNIPLLGRILTELSRAFIKLNLNTGGGGGGGQTAEAVILPCILWYCIIFHGPGLH